MKNLTLLSVLLLAALSFGQDATELEAQYTMCAKHSIPAEKCSADIYQQLKAKDSAPLDPATDTVLTAVKEYRSRLKNPDSIQVHVAYLTDNGAVCLDIGGQNGAGGMSVSRVVYVTSEWKGAKRLRQHWLDEKGFSGSGSADVQRMSGSGYEVDRWDHVCTKSGNLLPGKNVTEKVNQALKQ
jgi:hypothetical protein